MAEPRRLLLQDLNEIEEGIEFDSELFGDGAEKLLAHIAYLDTEIVRLEQELRRARGVAAQMLDDIEAERPGSGLKWLHDFH